MFLLMSSLNRLLIISPFSFWLYFVGHLLRALFHSFFVPYSPLFLLPVSLCLQQHFAAELYGNSCKSQNQNWNRHNNKISYKVEKNFCLWQQQFYKVFIFLPFAFEFTFEPPPQSGADKLKRNSVSFSDFSANVCNCSEGSVTDIYIYIYSNIYTEYNNIYMHTYIQKINCMYLQ